MTLTLTPSEERKVVSDRLRKQRQAEAKARRPKVHRPLAKGQRQPRKKDPAYLAWVRRLPCIAGLVIGGCEGPRECAHVRFSDAAAGRLNPGLQNKPDDVWVTPHCKHHHQDVQHRQNERRYWASLNIDPNALCRELRAAFEINGDGSAVLTRFASEARDGL